MAARITKANHSTAHTRLVADCLRWLSLRRITAWKQNTGAVRVGPRFVRFGVPGCSDILGILPGGRFLAIEVKTGSGKPTKSQAAFQGAVSAAGGLAIVARSLVDLETAIGGVEHGR